MLLDLVVHGWDMYRGADLDDQMNPEVVAHALGYPPRRATCSSGPGCSVRRADLV